MEEVVVAVWRGAEEGKVILFSFSCDSPSSVAVFSHQQTQTGGSHPNQSNFPQYGSCINKMPLVSSVSCPCPFPRATGFVVVVTGGGEGEAMCGRCGKGEKAKKEGKLIR